MGATLTSRKLGEIRASAANVIVGSALRLGVAGICGQNMCGYIVSESTNKTATILSAFKGGLEAEFAIDRAKRDRDLSFGMLFVLF